MTSNSPLRVRERLSRHWRLRSHQSWLQSRVSLLGDSCSTFTSHSSHLGLQQPALTPLAARIIIKVILIIIILQENLSVRVVPG